jgi:hypothetical protein
MSLNDWFPKLLGDPQQLGGNIPFGADASGQQNYVPGLLMDDASPQPDGPTTLMGYPLSQLQPQNDYPNFMAVHGLLTDTPGVNLTPSPYPDVPLILSSGPLANPGGNPDANAQVPIHATQDLSQPAVMPQAGTQQVVMPAALTNATQMSMPNMIALQAQLVTRPAATSNSDTLTPGQLLTYNAEGSYQKTNHPHWPGGTSGVTIGKGYDMGLRTVAQVKADLMQAGVDEARATRLAGGAGMKGNDAAAYVLDHSRDATLSPSEEGKLFQIVYPEKEQYAKGVYGRATKGLPYASKWEALTPTIRAVATDFAYQGTNHAQMRAISQNNANSLMQYIQNTPNIAKYEKGRGRINFLQQNP